MGVLTGLRVIEMAAIGPIPHVGMMLSDMGAEVIRIDRPSAAMSMDGNPADTSARGRKSITLNLKTEQGLDAAKKLIATADILLEGMRPGVMEKMGLGPEVCEGINPRLVFGRMTGWGQDGPLAQSAGHDINYIAITGALHAVGKKDSGPVPPLNVVGDYGGGAMYLLSGVLAAVIEAKDSGLGQVVDAAITDGTLSLMNSLFGYKHMGIWDDEREHNLLDGGAFHYKTYQCADDKWIAIGPIEPLFLMLLADKMQLDDAEGLVAAQFDKSQWQEKSELFAAVFRQKTQSQWCELLENTDSCFAPVLTMEEAIAHPHNKARQSHIDVAGVMQAAPAPRFSRTPSEIQGPPVSNGAHSEELLSSMGLTAQQIQALKEQGVIK